MAIGTTPLFSKLSGSAGPVDFRTRRNGKIEIGKKRIPANPQSTEQQNTRNAYGRLHELWQNAAWIDKTQYENIAAAYDISPWNAFLMRHLPIMRLNPVAYWPFVEGINNTLHDFTTNENHGTILGPTWERFGKFDIPNLYFDNIDDYIDCGAGTSMDLPNAHTVSTFLVFKTFTTSRQILQRRPPSKYNYNVDMTSLQRFRYTLYDGVNVPTIIQIGSSELNKNYQLTCSRNTSTQKMNMWINGELNNEINDATFGNIINGAATVKISQGTPYTPHGWIKEMIILNYALSDDQKKHLYNTSAKFLGT